MALKTAQFTYTDAQGFEKTVVLYVHSVVAHYRLGYTETIYEIFRDDDARGEGIEPVFISHRVPIDFSDAGEMSLILETSERLWNKNRTVPLILDYSDLVEGKRVGVLKSLNELGADISDTVRTAARKAR